MLPRRLTTNISYTPPGAMIHQVQFVNALSVDTDGNSGTPSTFATVWASVIAIKGSELIKADALVQSLKVQINTHYLEGLEESMTVLHDGRTYTIDYVEDPDGRKFEHRVYCTESGQNG